MTDVAGLHESAMPIVPALYGVGMVLGNLIGARFVDHSVTRTLIIGMVVTTGLSALFPLAAHNPITTTADLAALALVGTTVVLALQARLMDVAGPAQTLAASMNTRP